ncbi:hypothetical protein BMU06_18105 [Escherichia coli]|nr:hypothetical protein BMU06_18105 [Escherichia coli]
MEKRGWIVCAHKRPRLAQKSPTDVQSVDVNHYYLLIFKNQKSFIVIKNNQFISNVSEFKKQSVSIKKWEGLALPILFC